MKSNQLTINTEFINFVWVGGFSALVNITSRILFNSIFHYIISIIIAYLIGMTTAYFLCRLLVFTPKKNNTFQQIGYFILINVLAVLQTIIVSLVLVNYVFLWINDLSIRETFSHFIGVCVPVFTSYVGHKYLTFK